MLFGDYCIRFCYSCMTILLLRIFTELYTTSQHNSSNNKEEGSYIFCFFFNLIISYYFLTFFLSPTIVCFDCTNIHSDLIFLGESIQRLKKLRQRSDLSRHTVLVISPIFIQFVSLFYQCKNHTLCVS